MNKRRHAHGSIPAQITYLNLPHQRACQDECNGHVNHLIQSLDAKITLPRRWWVEIGITRVGDLLVSLMDLNFGVKPP